MNPIAPASRTGRPAALSAFLLAALAACTADRPGSGSGHGVAVATLQRVNASAHQCWLGDDAFKAYGIVPELDTSGTPRLLVIPRGKPQALPQLVIASSGGPVEIYGPLAASPLAPRIRADVARWADGRSGCTA